MENPTLSGMNTHAIRWLALLLCAGCADVPMETHVISDPPGARIEVNGSYVGPAPVDVTLPQTANRHRLKGRTIILAMQVAPGQKLQEKVLQNHQQIPSQVLFDMRLGQQAGSKELSTPAATNEPPAEAKPATNISD
jgi:hypothetical protein